MFKMSVLQGDITRVANVDAIVTLVNSGRMWFGGVDGAIQRLSSQYHSRLGQVPSLTDGEVIVVEGKDIAHTGSFNDVVFVVDDLKTPLSELVYSALQAAKGKGYTSIALPLMRTGVMLGAVEKTLEAVVNQMQLGIDRSLKNNNGSIINLYVVVYGKPEANIDWWNSLLG